MSASSQTIGELIRYLIGNSKSDRILRWPPDIFAVVGSILQKSGAYVGVVIDSWPPKEGRRSTDNFKAWNKYARGLGARWRAAADANGAPPKRITELWRRIIKASQTPVLELGTEQHRRTCHALLELCVAADQACAGVGMPTDQTETSRETLDFRVMMLFAKASKTKQCATLCRQIDPSKAVVLPKMHTPQIGITFRSLTHHLALCTGGEVTVRWQPLPQERVQHSLNLLIVPWPKCAIPSQFRPLPKHKSSLRSQPPDQDFFEYQLREFEGCNDHYRKDMSSPEQRKVWENCFRDLLKQAKRHAVHVDGVVFPEVALTENEFKIACNMLKEEGLKHTFLVSGVAEKANARWSRNVACVHFPLLFNIPGEGEVLLETNFVQPKHHRWKVEASQISQYSLGGSLDVNKQWWESCAIDQRQLNFFALKDWLCFCVLICEDLARQDPISDLVRSVGPNLVIALLQDGPQLAVRWPARYATVLADDPGSSVLTLTNLGMARLSRVIGKPESRVIAMWKDITRQNPVEIELPVGAQAVVLSLSGIRAEEFTADGRTDGGVAGYLKLSGVIPIFPS